MTLYSSVIAERHIISMAILPIHTELVRGPLKMASSIANQKCILLHVGCAITTLYSEPRGRACNTVQVCYMPRTMQRQLYHQSDLTVSYEKDAWHIHLSFCGSFPHTMLHR